MIYEEEGGHYMKRRRTYLVTGIILSLCLIIGIGCVGLAAMGKLQPEQIFYPVRFWSENIQLKLIRDNNKKIERQIKFANKRLDNLHHLAGTAYEPLAARRLVEIVEDAGATILTMDRNERRDINPQFIKFSLIVQSSLAELPVLPAKYPWTYIQLQTRLAELIAALSQESNANKIAPTPMPTYVSDAIALIPTPTPKPPTYVSIQDDIIPVVDFLPEFDPHTLGGRCNSCHNLETDCSLCHKKILPGYHYDLNCTTCHQYQDWHTIVLDHLVSEFYGCTDCHLEIRPEDHFEGECSTCHKTTWWKPANIAHTVIDRFPCLKCHEYQRPAGHYEFPCTTCHGMIGWLPVQVDHSDPGLSDCMACHSAKQPANHYNVQCSYCHTPTFWNVVRFDHQAIGAVNCRSCHSQDKPGNHYDAQCSNCHKTNAWLPARFNHAAVNTSQCINCHSKDNHYSIQCSYCHNTRSWGSVDFNHGAVNATNCVGCHSDDAPSDHFGGQCSDCHNTDNWHQADFNHKEYGATDCIDCHSDDAPEDHYDGQCSECHSTNNWDFDHDGLRRCNNCHEPGKKGDD